MPPYDWKSFLVFAQAVQLRRPCLESEPGICSDTLTRVIVGRTYYAVFHRAKMLVVAEGWMPDTWGTSVHHELLKILKEKARDRKELFRIWKALDGWRDVRNWADYEASKSAIQYPNQRLHPTDMPKFIEAAFDLHQYIESVDRRTRRK